MKYISSSGNTEVSVLHIETLTDEQLAFLLAEAETKSNTDPEPEVWLSLILDIKDEQAQREIWREICLGRPA